MLVTSHAGDDASRILTRCLVISLNGTWSFTSATGWTRCPSVLRKGLAIQPFGGHIASLDFVFWKGFVDIADWNFIFGRS
jgi:hypothetical protein